MRKEINHGGKANIFIAEAGPLPPERKPKPSKKMLYVEKISKREEKHPNIKKGFKKVRKRTNRGAGLPPDYSPPANAHTEGETWIRCLNKQTQADRKVFVRKQLNSAGKRKM
ncbi:MAG: hypothetical protein ACHQT8_06930 [Chlamydiales bacterium]